MFTLQILPLVFLMFALLLAANWIISLIKKDRIKKEQPQQAEAHRPFPQHVSYPAKALKPDHLSQEDMDRSVRLAYGEWLAAYMLPDIEAGRAFLRMGVDKRRMRYFVYATSIGQGLAMWISTLIAGDDLNAQGRFDRLFAFCQARPSRNQFALASGYSMPDVVPSLPAASRSQGDMLIAYSLLMADKQWGSIGQINYRAEAQAILQALQETCIHPESLHVLQGNDTNENNHTQYASTLSINYAPALFDAFSTAKLEPIWPAVSKRMAGLVQETLNGENIFPPPSIITASQEMPVETQTFLPGNTIFLLNLSLAMLCCPKPEYEALLDAINHRLLESCNGDPGKIVSAYNLKGEPLSQEPSLAMTAAFAMASIWQPGQAWVNALWDHLAASKIDREDTFGATIRLLALMTLSGNLWHPNSKANQIAG